MTPSGWFWSKGWKAALVLAAFLHLLVVAHWVMSDIAMREEIHVRRLFVR